MDVIAMSENGINNAVATLGIATNRFHTQVLLQLVNEVIFCFSGPVRSLENKPQNSSYPMTGFLIISFR